MQQSNVSKSVDIEALWHDITEIRKLAPLVHNITNFVVMQQTANALLAIGASPIMTQTYQELNEIINISNALVINIGSITEEWMTAMYEAQQIANACNVPIILDPVASGASKIRTQLAAELISNGVTIVRGNASEIMSLINSGAETKGVDSLHQSRDAINAAEQIAERYGCSVIISGAEDYIISCNNQSSTAYGSPLMTKVTGMGCTATAITGAFAAVNCDPHSAAFHSMATMSIVGSLTAKNCNAPGSFAVRFIDNLYLLNREMIMQIVHHD